MLDPAIVNFSQAPMQTLVDQVQYSVANLATVKGGTWA
jgi:hypothetical protein